MAARSVSGWGTFFMRISCLNWSGLPAPGRFQRRRGTLRLVGLVLLLLVVPGATLRSAGHGVTRVVGLQAARRRAVQAPSRGDDLSPAHYAGARLLPAQ